MAELTHGFRIDVASCQGCLACMRACPTYAIRVKGGKARVRSELCIDCGSCLAACTHGAIAALTRTLEDIGRDFAFKVAVPSPVLFGQFPAEVKGKDIVRGLCASGFDAVWDYAVEVELAMRAVVAYVEGWRGPRPLINTNCPVVVRLIQVAYPRMTDQLIHMQPPREIAGRALKRRYAEELGLPAEQIGAIYVTPCQARTISILQPAEGGTSCLDGAVGIQQVYNTILAVAQENKRSGGADAEDEWEPIRSAGHLRWATPNRFEDQLRGYGYMSVTGLSNVIAVCDDIERGKLTGIDVLECHACWAGCASGNLTVDNVYVSQAKLQRLMTRLPESDPQTAAEVRRRWPAEAFSLAQPFAPRAAAQEGDLRARVRRVKEAERIAATLPGVDCGLCGAPACAVFARDVALGSATLRECVFVSDARLDQLRRMHGSEEPVEA